MPPYQVASRYEKDVVRTLSNPKNEFRNSHARTPHHMLQGTVTPNGLFFTIAHSGLPDIDPAQHKLVIHGLVKQPLVYTVDQLSRYPMVTRMHFLECSGNSAPMFSSEPLQVTAQALHGLVSNAEWTGVPLSTLLEETGIDPKAKWLLAEGTNSLGLHRSVPIKKAMDDAIIVLYQNGERSDARQRLSDAPAAARLSGQHERQARAPDQADRSAGHELLRVQDLLADSAERQKLAVPLHPGGEVVHHASVVRPRDEGPGLLRHLRRRLFGQRPHRQGHGLGRRRQELGAGRAAGPVSPKAFTRFRMPWKWDGQPAVLQSRAWDEAGNVQPLRADFVAARGQTEKPVASPLAFPNQHYNSITSWGIGTNGEIKHVYA